jgi:multiple sugar transport system permease protein
MKRTTTIQGSSRLAKEVALKFIVYVSLGVFSIIFIFPFLWMLSNSFKPSGMIFQFPPVLLPPLKVLSLQGYHNLFKTIPFARWMLNSGIVAVSDVVGALIINTMAAYACARLKFPGRDLIFAIFLLTLMVPFQIVMIPSFIFVNALKWVNTFWGLIIPWLPNAFSIFFLRQYFRTIPADLEEAAFIDGASKPRIFTTIIIPLSTPAIVTIALMTFMWGWDDFLWPLIVIRSKALWVVQLGITNFFGDHLNQWDMIMAAATVATLPTYLLFLFLQRYYIQGVALTGIKG